MTTMPVQEKITEQDQLLLARASQKSPEFFIQDILGDTLWEKQKEIIRGLQTHHEVAVRSNNAAGKTFTASRALLWWMFSEPDSAVITTAPTFRQVEQILWREVRSAYRKSRIPLGGEMLKTRLELDDNWFALGLSADSPDEFQGFHSRRILIIVDEPTGVSDPIYEAIDGVMASGNARLLMIGNPTKKTGRYAASFTMPGVKKIHISAFDTPNLVMNNIRSVEDLTEEKIAQARIFVPGLVSAKWVFDMKQKWGVDHDVFRVRVQGEFPVAEIDVLVTIDDVAQAMDRLVETPEDAEEWLGVDVARFGDDKTVIVYTKGNYAKVLARFGKKDNMETAGKVKNYLEQYPNAKANIDDTGGFGAGVIDRLHEQGFKQRVFGINFSQSATDEEHFKNIRAEGYFNLKDWIKTAHIEKDDDMYEVAVIKYKTLSSGQFQIEDKEDIKKRIGRSPDTADALMLARLRPVLKKIPNIRVL